MQTITIRANPNCPATSEAVSSVQTPNRVTQETTECTPQPRAASNLNLNSFHLIRIIGTGCCSVVQIVEDKNTGRACALKTMKKEVILARKNVQHVMDEKSVLSKVRHPHIVEFYGAFQDAKHLYLLMEYVAGGELYSLLTNRVSLMSTEARFYAAEVAQVLSYLHSEGVVYRDLKPENILISASGHIKLTDFGFAKMLPRGERAHSLCGTPQYLAPEVVKRAGHSFEYDWWTLGILLYEMLTGYTPFEADTPYELYANIVTKSFEMPKDLDNVTVSFITGLLTKDPAERLSGSDVLQHPYFSGVDWNNMDDTSPPHVPNVKNEFDDRYFDKYPAEEEENQSLACCFNNTVFEGF